MRNFNHHLFALSASLGVLLCVGAVHAADKPVKMGELMLCNPGPDAAAVFFNDGLMGIDAKLAEGSATCAKQTMTVLGKANGFTYVYWTAEFAEKTPEGAQAGALHFVGQVGEVAADGTVTPIYRLSEEGPAAIEAHLVTRDGDIFVVIDESQPVILMRGKTDFAAIDANSFELDTALVKAAMPPEYVAERANEVGNYDTRFNAEDLSLSIPVASAFEVFPRTFVKPDYDRNITLRFPLHKQGNALVPGKGEIVVGADETIGGIGETPLTVVVPDTLKSCELSAFVEDNHSENVAVRATPDAAGDVIATLARSYDRGQESWTLGARVEIVSASNGWFLIEDATHPIEMFGETDEEAELPRGVGGNEVRSSYRGRGWVNGTQLSVFIQAAEALRATAEPNPRTVFDLLPHDEHNTNVVTALLDCQGDAALLAVTRSNGAEGEGWLDTVSETGQAQLCANQVTTCS